MTIYDSVEKWFYTTLVGYISNFFTISGQASNTIRISCQFNNWSSCIFRYHTFSNHYITLHFGLEKPRIEQSQLFLFLWLRFLYEVWNHNFWNNQKDYKATIVAFYVCCRKKILTLDFSRFFSAHSSWNWSAASLLPEGK